jgi:hypothetical protein
MPYRSNEAVTDGLASALRFMCSPKNLGAENAAAAAMKIESLTQVWGPVVEAYPSWHPLVAAGNKDPLSPAITPKANCGYEGVDHSIYFRNAFLTCPYGDGKEVIASVRKIKFPSDIKVEAEIIDIPIYHPNATPVLVTCSWTPMPEDDGTINRRYAIGTMLEMELALWRGADVAETWETMRPYFLGLPCGSKSSLFVNQDTGQAMKRAWQAIIEAGIFGRVRS